MIGSHRGRSGGSGTQILLPAAYPHVFYSAGQPTRMDQEIFGEYRQRVFGASAGARAANYPVGSPLQIQFGGGGLIKEIKGDENLRYLFVIVVCVLLIIIFVS